MTQQAIPSTAVCDWSGSSLYTTGNRKNEDSTESRLEVGKAREQFSLAVPVPMPVPASKRING